MLKQNYRDLAAERLRKIQALEGDLKAAEAEFELVVGEYLETQDALLDSLLGAVKAREVEIDRLRRLINRVKWFLVSVDPKDIAQRSGYDELKEILNKESK